MISTLLGDWRFFWPQTLKDLAHYPYAWDSFLNTGVGHPGLGTLWITSYLHLTSYLHEFGLSWFWISLIFWQLPPLLLGFFGTYLLSKRLFAFSAFYSSIAGILFIGNTYFFLLFFGGQIGVALGYSLIPWVLLCALRAFSRPNLRTGVLLGLALSGALFFDPRVFFLCFSAIALLALFIYRPRGFASLFHVVVLPLLIIFLLHLFWIAPVLVYKTTGVENELGNSESFRFFSFGGFDYAFALLHPNWPENIFGKVAFLNPFFLIFPIIAMSSLLFTTKKNVLMISYFVILSIIAAFIAKGAKEPFSAVNFFVFEHIPGMGLFRDSTKFYMLIALSYSLLIPFTLFSLAEILGKKLKKYQRLITWVVPVVWLLVVVFLLSPFFLRGGFGIRTVPQTYEDFYTFLSTDTSFSRTLWLPAWQRYGYFSSTHPAVGRNEIVKDTTVEGVRKFFSKPESQKTLEEWGIRYVVIPQDSEGELFLTDRKYDDKKRKKYATELDKIHWLKRIDRFQPMLLYELDSPKDHFWSIGEAEISYQRHSSTDYTVFLKNAEDGDMLVFAEGFDKHWVAREGSSVIPSKPFKERMNSFSVPKDGNYTLQVSYAPQRLVNILLIVSVVTFLSIILLLTIDSLRRRV